MKKYFNDPILVSNKKNPIGGSFFQEQASALMWEYNFIVEYGVSPENVFI